jgi:hypothetical protein
MATRWSQTPDGVRAVPDGTSRAASVLAALLTITGTTVALLIVGAMLLPASGPTDQAGTAAGAPSATPAVVAANRSVASPAPVPTGEPVASSAGPAGRTPPAASAAPGSPRPASTTAPRASAAPSIVPVLVAFRTVAPVNRGGREVGRVTVQAVRQVKSANAVADDRRLMVAQVRLDTRSERLPYDELHFRLEDDNGDRYEPVTEAAPEPLGSGTLAPSSKRSGQIAFAIPTGRKVVSVILTDGAGDDLVVFSRPQPAG